MRFLMILLGVLCAFAWLGAASPTPDAVDLAAGDLPDDFSDALRFKRAPEEITDEDVEEVLKIIEEAEKDSE